MADKPEDFRKMAEISDAIQDILNGGETEDATEPSEQTPVATVKTAAETAVVPDESNDDGMTDMIDAGLEAAIAAELAGQNNVPNAGAGDLDTSSERPAVFQSEPAFTAGLDDDIPSPAVSGPGDFGAGPDLTQFESGADTGSDTGSDTGVETSDFAAPGQNIASDIAAGTDFDNPVTLTPPADISAVQGTASQPPGLSDNTLLSVRMRDVLANMKTEQETEEANRRLFLEMQAAQDDILSKMRSLNAANEEKLSLSSANIAAQVDAMKHAIAETSMEIEHLAVVFDQKIKEIHTLYQENFENERNRLNQYRDFIEFLLNEKR